MTTDIYFSADVETDGPIPGPYSKLSFGITVAGTFDGTNFSRPESSQTFYRELRPISENFEEEAVKISGLDRDRLMVEGADPAAAMGDCAQWIESIAKDRDPILVAFPLGFDWMWLYWYFIKFAKTSSFKHSRCLDIKTMYATKARLPVSQAGLGSLPAHLGSERPHTHHALDDALEQADVFARVFEWSGDEAEGSK